MAAKKMENWTKMNTPNRVKRSIATASVLALFAASCGGTTESETLQDEMPETLAATDEEVVIDWFVGLGTGEAPAQIAAQEKVVEAFNASQDGITLKLEVVDQRLAYDVLDERIEAGNTPDIVGPVGFLGSAAFGDEFRDLTDLIDDEVLSAYDPEQVAVWAGDEGEVEALPFGVMPSMIFYNRDLFDRAGLPYPPAEFGGTYRGEPWDVDAMTELATELTLDANGNNPTDPEFDDSTTVQWGFAHQWIDDPRSNGAFFGAGSLEAEDGTAQIPDNWKAEWEWVHENMWDTNIMPTYEDRGSQLLQNGNQFASGRVAMAFTHFWYASSINSEEGEPREFWDLAATPSYDGEITSKLHADTFRIMDRSDNPNEAYEALSYLLDDAAAELLQVYGSFPARVELRDEFFAGLAERYPEVENWEVVSDALQYPDIPQHEALLPAPEESQAILDAFAEEIGTDPELDMDSRVEKLRTDLDAAFAEAE